MTQSGGVRRSAGGRTGPAASGVRAVRAEVARRRERRRVRRHRRRMIALWTVLAIVAAFVSFTGGLLSAPVDFTAPAAPRSAILLDRHGKVFAAIRSPEQRAEVPGSQIPAVMRQAIVSAEDRTFYHNAGVDPIAIMRAAYKDLTGSSLQGASTITQQYVKQVYTNRQRTLLRKIREAALAVRLERKLSKAEILTRYLNTTYFGQGTYGVQAASKYYYGVPVDELDRPTPSSPVHDNRLALARASMLAGIVIAPSVDNPVVNLPAARKRQLYVLNRMVDDGKITTQQASDAYGQQAPRIVKKSAPEVPTIAPEFRDYVRAGLVSTFTSDQIFEGGLRVRTSLDLDLQKAVVAAVHKVLPSKSDPEAAVIAIDPRNGDIRAMTTRFVKKHVNGYQTEGTNLVTDAERSTGSTIKPFTLAAALESGLSLDTVRYGPTCVSIPNPGGTPNPYRPCNAGDGEAGTFTLQQALAYSVNTIYAPLAADIGLHKVMRVAARAGLRPKQNLRTNLANALGVEITPISAAVGYSTLVNHGVRHQPRSILTVRAGGNGSANSGDVIYRAPKEHGFRAMPAKIADQVDEALASVVEYGTGTAARQPFTVYGKTGTTQDETNAWFDGCTRTLCIVTWMGYDRQYNKSGSPNSMLNVEGVPEVFGGTLPAQIFADTWSKYRAIKEAEAHPHKSATPTSSPVPVHTVAPQPTATHLPPTHAPRPTHSPTPKPSPTRSATPSPSPSTRPTLPIPHPTGSSP